MEIMHPALKLIETVTDLDAALAGSDLRPILIFKHSATCGTSAIAYEEVTDQVVELARSVDVYLVRIQAARIVSRAIEERLGVRHESPQVLLVSGNRVLWQATHYRVTAGSIAAAVQKHVPDAQTVQ